MVEVTHLGGIKKKPSFTCNLTTPPSWGALSEDYLMVVKHVTKSMAVIHGRVLAFNALYSLSCFQFCGFQFALLMMQGLRQRQVIGNLARIWFK